jgi:hypothetical protein
LFIGLISLTLFTSCSTENDIRYSNSFYQIILNGKTGSLKTISKNGKNLLSKKDSAGPLFRIRLRDQANKGEIHDFNALQAGSFKIKHTEELITLTYSSFKDIDATVTVSVNVSEGSPFMNWNLSIDNRSPYTVDFIDFPNVVVPDDLIATGGTGRIFWPAQEGCLVEDMRIREEGPWLKFRSIEYPQMGWGGLYPSSTQMQYMAYYNSNGGLYLAAHDENCIPKGIEFHREGENGIKLDFRLFPGGPGKGEYKDAVQYGFGSFRWRLV